jgi:quercetin dioxygenase-like cupin family protein
MVGITKGQKPAMSQLPILKKRKVVVNRPGLKVVQFYLSRGERIPEHHTNADVVVTTVRGKGIFTIGSIPHEMSPGVVLEMSPGIPHAIEALEELEFVVVHMHLEEKASVVSCGADKNPSQ